MEIEKKKNIHLFVSGLASGAVVLLLIGLTVWMYTRPLTDPVLRAVSRTLPFPAAFVGGKVVPIRDVVFEYDALTNYFKTLPKETVPAFGDELEKNLMDTIVNRAMVDRLADRYGVKPEANREETFLQNLTGAGETEEQIAVQIRDSFGWSVEDFRQHIVRPVVLSMQLEEYVAGNQGLQAVQRKRIDDAVQRLKNGDAFSVVAGETNEDESAKTGGDVGMVAVSSLPSVWTDVLKDLKPDTFSDILEDQDAYYVFTVTERTVATAEEGGEEQYRLSMIRVLKRTVEELIEEELQQTKIWRLVGRG